MSVQKVNLNTLAKTISAFEGGKKQISIGQIKEVLNVLGSVLSKATTEFSFEIVAALIKAGRSRT